MTELTKADLPEGFLGSVPEYMVLEELKRQGKVEGVHFTYQTSLQGGRIEKGGVVLDFLFADPPGLAINVQGIYFHYEQGVTQRTIDLLARSTLASQGIRLVFIDEDAIYEDVEYYVSEALRFVDHSRLGRG